jgi:hypothetical protein
MGAELNGAKAPRLLSSAWTGPGNSSTDLSIEGEGYARAWLERLLAGLSDPGDLALTLRFLDGPMLDGACRVIEAALKGCRNG